MSEAVIKKVPQGKLRKNDLKEYVTGFCMILPAIVFLCVFTIYPLFKLVVLSLFRGSTAKPQREYLGLDNYAKLLFNRVEFWDSLKNTAVYTAWIVFLLISFAVLFAVWFQRDRRLNSIAQSAFFVPHLVASVSCSFIFSWIFSSESSGIMNTLLRGFGLASKNWLGSSETALLCIIIMNTWKSIGYYALIILSALKAVPVEIYEAARIDGSSSARTFFRITLPMLSPQIFMLLITITSSSFKVFDSVRLMTGGGPGTSTTMLCMFIYDFAYNRTNMLGMACAGSVLLVVILMLITLLNFKGFEKRVHYQ